MNDISIEVITIADLQSMLGGVSYTTASRRMREIKNVSDLLGLKGKILKTDWNNFIKQQNQKQSEV